MIDLQVKELPLQHAYVNAFAEDGIQGDYNVISKDQQHLGTWAKSLGDRNIHPMLKFAKKYEKEAYLKGRADEEEKAKAYILVMKQKYESMLKEAKELNISLAKQLTILEKEI